MDNSYFRIRLEHKFGRRKGTEENEFHIKVRTQADIIDDFEAKLKSISIKLDNTINENSRLSQKFENETELLKIENVELKKQLFDANSKIKNLEVNIIFYD